VSNCCTEHNCTRKQPISLYLGDFSDIVYAVTRYRVRGAAEDGREHRVALDRHDITGQMKTFIRANPGFVRSVLEEENT
jgi:hypothetical protein